MQTRWYYIHRVGQLTRRTRHYTSLQMISCMHSSLVVLPDIFSLPHISTKNSANISSLITTFSMYFVCAVSVKLTPLSHCSILGLYACVRVERQMNWSFYTRAWTYCAAGEWTNIRSSSSRLYSVMNIQRFKLRQSMQIHWPRYRISDVVPPR